jgi:hypothetical protein
LPTKNDPNTHRLIGNLVRKGNKLVLDCEVDAGDSSDGSSTDAPVAEGGEGGDKDENKSKSKSDAGEGRGLDKEDKIVHNDLDEYGERLMDEEGGEEDVEVGADKVCYHI